MSLLPDFKIIEYCDRNQMLDPCKPDRVKPSSYDLSVGSEYRFSHEKNTRRLDEGGCIDIPPYTLCYLMCEERINLPDDIAAAIYPRNRFVRHGMLMYPQPPIEPGSEGRLYILVHNLSNEKRVIEKGEHVASLVFYKLLHPARNPYGSSDEDVYDKKETLDGLRLGCNNFSPYTSALREVSDRLNKWSVSLLSTYIPIILVLITIILAILTVIFGATIFGVSSQQTPTPTATKTLIGSLFSSIFALVKKF